MGTLPWQVVYGQWIGWTNAAVLVIIGHILFWGWLRAVARRRATMHRASLGTATESPTVGPVTLRGRIEVPGAPVPALDGSGAAAVCTVEASSETLRFAPDKSKARRYFRAPSLHLVTKHGTTSLRGAIAVTVGSRETFPGSLSALDSDDRERLLAKPDEIVCFGTGTWPKALRTAGMIRTIRHGDEVIVKGLVRPRLGDGGLGASYRPMDTALEIIAGDGHDAIEIVAAHAGTLSFGKTALLARGLAVGLVLSLSVGVIMGGSARRVDDFATAALFPPHRAWAIDELAKEATEGPPSQSRLETIIAYDSVDPDCQRTGDALLEHEQWNRAATVLAGCQEPKLKERAVMAHVMAGSPAQACDVLRTLSDDAAGGAERQAVIFALGGCTSDAAVALRRFAANTPDEPRREAANCIADSLMARSGDSEALTRLSSKGAELCRIAHASLLSGDARAKALAFLVHAPQSEQRRQSHRLLTQALWSTVRDDPGAVALAPLPTPSRMLEAPEHALPNRAHGLEDDALHHLIAVKSPSNDVRALRVALAIRGAAFHVVAGSTQRADLLLNLADADTEALSTSARSSTAWVEQLRARAQIASLRVLASLLRGRIDDAHNVLSPWSSLSASRFLDDHPAASELPADLATIRSDVVLPLEDAKALVTLAENRRQPNGMSLAATVAIVGGPSALLVHGPTATEDAATLVAAHPRAGMALIAMGRFDAADDRVQQWLQFEARTVRSNPMALMLDAMLAARAAHVMSVPHAAALHEAAAHGMRDGLLQRDAAIVFALFDLD